MLRDQIRQLSRVAVLSLPIALGCRSDHGILGVDRCADIPPGAIPQPIGTYNCQWQQSQAQRAEQDYFVLYDYEWRAGADQLGPFGARHLDELSKRLESEPFVIVIAKTDNEQLNEQRRGVVIEVLRQRGVADASSRVTIGYPEAEGLYGFEARRVGAGFTGQGAGGGGTLGQGGGGNIGGGAGGGIGGGGFGGGGGYF